MATPNIRLFMPSGGEDGLIIGMRNDGFTVEFRGRPYSLWDESENTPMFQLHSSLQRVDISQLHNGEVEILTPWHSEWEDVNKLFNDAIESTG